MTSRLPLQGCHVVDLTRNLAGPYAAMILAELGANVVKVETPGRGDDTREWGPPFWGAESPIFLAVNRNKRSIALDLSTDHARGVLTRLTGRADVLLVDGERPPLLRPPPGLGEHQQEVLEELGLRRSTPEEA